MVISYLECILKFTVGNKLTTESPNNGDDEKDGCLHLDAVFASGFNKSDVLVKHVDIYTSKVRLNLL